MINLIYNGTKILISEQQVLRRINTEYQHIIIMHIDNRYKWKLIREKTTSYYFCDAKASSNSLSPLIFYRLQPTGGYYLKFYKLQLARKLQHPSIFYRLQPTRDSYLNQLQLDIYQATTWNGSTNSHVFFCRLWPTGGSYLNQLQLDIYQATAWNGSTNSHVFPIGNNP